MLAIPRADRAVGCGAGCEEGVRGGPLSPLWGRCLRSRQRGVRRGQPQADEKPKIWLFDRRTPGAVAKGRERYSLTLDPLLCNLSE